MKTSIMLFSYPYKIAFVNNFPSTLFVICFMNRNKFCFNLDSFTFTLFKNM